MEVFESYFQRADLDRDGRISGAEAVAFFRGSGLPNQTLARIWAFADTSNGGFLGRPEFYNYLRLVTVAQSGRDLTPDIVKAALYGPAAAKIPAPQINPVVGSTSHINPSGPQSGVVTSALSPGFAGPQMPLGAGMSQQVLPPSAGQFTRQFQAASGGQGPHTGFPGASSVTGPRPPNSNLPNMSANLPVAGPGAVPHGSHPQVPYGGSSTPPVISNGLGISLAGPMPVANFTQKTMPGLGSGMVYQNPQDLNKDSKAPVASGNGFSPVSAFGGSVFSATSQAEQSTTTPTFPASNVLTSTSLASATGTQASVKQSQPEPFAGMVSLPSNSSQRPPLGINPSQVGTDLGNPGSMLPTTSVGSSVSTSSQTWPRMSLSNIQKYTNVFVKVDSDRDGKITGEEARGLFLSWRLPREVLKQVWDLSDQDSDSMLSLREFCIALYLMERSREGRPLPEVLPDSVKFDPLLPPASQPTTAYGGGTWRMASGMPSGRPPLPGMKPSAQPPGSHLIDGVASVQQKSRAPVPDRQLVNQLHKEDQNILTSKFQEAKDSDNKIERAEKEILDSKEKIEFYRTKMQELVLYKSRCDNRLNEITERALANKREMESLGKKYEEKYKQVAEIASKLTIEEASFREIQERKMELHNAIVKMEQGGTVDGLLQVRVDRIQSELGELVKALNERCKKHGLQMKPTVLVELPFGWQPGIQEGSADWDEDWDKFEDEEFIMVKELTVDGPNITAPEKPKSNLVWIDKAPDGGKSDNSSRPSSPLLRGEIENPEEKSTPESPFHSNGNSLLDVDREEAKFASPRDRENYSNHGAAPASSSDGFAVDEWPTFDANDDADSVWGLSSKEPDGEGFKESAFFNSNDLGLNPIRTKESPRADNHFQTRSTFFADSVPGTPFFNSNSPSKFSQMSEEHSFDNFSRFDSFNMHDSGLFAPRETLTRFDSIRSTSDVGGFTSFDDTDPFGSTGPFKTLESETPKYSDLFSSSGTFKSFDQTPKHSDPFGMSSPFKSVEGETPRRISDNWSAF